MAEIADEIRRRLAARRNPAAPASRDGNGAQGGVVRLAELATDDDRSYVRSLYQRVLMRDPSEQELAAALGHLAATTRADLAREFHSSAEARDKGRVIFELLKPSEQARFGSPALDASVPPIDRSRKIYSLEDLLIYSGASFVTHIYRCLLKRDPAKAALVGHLEALEEKRTTPLELVYEISRTPEAKLAGVIVAGLPERPGADGALRLAPVDVSKKEYTLRELVDVPEQILIPHLYRALLKRDPDPQGAADLDGRLRAGHLAADLIFDMSRSEEARERGVRVTGLGGTWIRRHLAGFPVIGRVVEIAACLAYLPELARQFRVAERRRAAGETERTRVDRSVGMRLDSLDAQVAAVGSRLDRVAIAAETKAEPPECIALPLLEGKVGYQQFYEALASKADRTEVQEAIQARVDRAELHSLLADKANLEQLASFEERKADRGEVQAALEGKAAWEEVEAALAKKADRGEVQAELERKAAREEVEAALAKKADRDEVEAALEKKPAREELEAALAKKADFEWTEAVLAEKADRQEMEAALAKKAEAEVVYQLAVEKANLRQIASLEARKADREEVEAALAKKADVEAVHRLEVDKANLEQLASFEARKADRYEVEAALAKKADVEEVHRLADEKADRQAVEAALAGKADAEALARLEVEKASQEQVANLEASKADASALEEVAAATAAAREEAAARLAQLSERCQNALAGIHSHKLRILDLERRLGLILEEVRKRLPAPLAQEQLQTVAKRLERLDAAMYVEFEDVFRGTREDIKRRQTVYLPYLAKAPCRKGQYPVLDVGCGRGEFLEILAESGYSAKGVDINPVMVERCRELGLDVEQADGIEFLRNAKASQYAAVTAFHVVEHLPHESVLALLDEALRVLRPGGLLIIETPNPQNLIVGSCNFYMDPTHRNPIPPPLLRFVVEARGFVNAEIKLLHPPPEEAHPAAAGLPGELAALLYGPQDYGVIAWKA